MGKGKMTTMEIMEHKKNPNILLKVGGNPFRCDCGCNVFHHKDNWDIYICNACNAEYETAECSTKEKEE
jgi:hypothetical protein